MLNILTHVLWTLISYDDFYLPRKIGEWIVTGSAS